MVLQLSVFYINASRLKCDNPQHEATPPIPTLKLRGLDPSRLSNNCLRLSADIMGLVTSSSGCSFPCLFVGTNILYLFIY